MSQIIQWRCFHCGDTFTKAQERWARDHFGRDEGELPVCQLRLPGEHHLLTALRKAQDELARYRAEDGDLMRAIYAMRADHTEALRREEERGYAKGLADARLVNHCHGDRDGDCSWEHCPQLREGEPAATGRHCPLDVGCSRCCLPLDECEC